MKTRGFQSPLASGVFFLTLASISCMRRCSAPDRSVPLPSGSLGGAKSRMYVSGTMVFAFPAKAMTEMYTVSRANGSLIKASVSSWSPLWTSFMGPPAMDSETSRTMNTGSLLIFSLCVYCFSVPQKGQTPGDAASAKNSFPMQPGFPQGLSFPRVRLMACTHSAGRGRAAGSFNP